MCLKKIDYTHRMDDIHSTRRDSMRWIHVVVVYTLQNVLYIWYCGGGQLPDTQGKTMICLRV